MQEVLAEDPTMRRTTAAPTAVSKGRTQVDGAALRMNTNRNHNNSASAGDVSSDQQTAHRAFSAQDYSWAIDG